MADENTTPPKGEGKTALEARVEIVTLIYELGVLLESVAAALEALAVLVEAKPVEEQLKVVGKLAAQALLRWERLDAELKAHFAAEGGNGG